MSGKWAMRLKPTRGAVAVDLVGLAAAVGDAAGEADLVVVRLGLHRGDDAVHRVDGVEVVGRDDHRAVGVLQGGREAAADHVAEDVEDHHVGVFQKVVLLQELDGLADDVAAAAGACGRAASLDADHAVVAGGDEILGAEFLGVEVDLLEDVDHRRDAGCPVRVKVESCLGSQPICRTRLPSLEKATERFDEVVDLPMPPLP